MCRPPLTCLRSMVGMEGVPVLLWSHAAVGFPNFTGLTTASAIMSVNLHRSSWQSKPFHPIFASKSHLLQIRLLLRSTRLFHLRRKGNCPLLYPRIFPNRLCFFRTQSQEQIAISGKAVVHPGICHNLMAPPCNSAIFPSTQTNSLSAGGHTWLPGLSRGVTYWWQNIHREMVW